MFPGGVPGVGLVILRLCAAGASLACVLASDSNVLEWPFVVLAPIAVLLIIGLLTPFTCVTLLGLQGAIAYRFGMFGLWHCWLSLFLAISVLTIGPGAYSCDSVLFGRRRLTVRSAPLDKKSRL